MAAQLRRLQREPVRAELVWVGVPETWLHGDRHPLTIAVRDGKALAFDRTDAAPAHPYLELVTFVDAPRWR